MSRFSGPQHPGAQAQHRSERRADADARNLLTAPERRRQYRLNPPTDEGAVVEPDAVATKRKRNRKS